MSKGQTKRFGPCRAPTNIRFFLGCSSQNGLLSCANKVIRIIINDLCHETQIVQVNLVLNGPKYCGVLDL